MEKHKANIWVKVESTGKTYSTEIDVYKADEVDKRDNGIIGALTELQNWFPKSDNEYEILEECIQALQH